MDETPAFDDPADIFLGALVVSIRAAAAGPASMTEADFLEQLDHWIQDGLQQAQSLGLEAPNANRETTYRLRHRIDFWRKKMDEARRRNLHVGRY